MIRLDFIEYRIRDHPPQADHLTVSHDRHVGYGNRVSVSA